jgi:26 proteasome complex subunit DSS1
VLKRESVERKMSEAKTKTEVKTEIQNVIEEDDEFEEFADEGKRRHFVCLLFANFTHSSLDWGAEQEDAEDAQQWQEDWDEEEVDDEFCRHLRQELQANAAS